MVAGTWQHRRSRSVLPPLHGPSGSIDTIHFGSHAYLIMAMTDEYTALQKYISTYRDPKAAAAEDGTDDGPVKKKPWYKVSCLL